SRDRRRVPVPRDPRVQGVRRGVPADGRRAGDVDRAREPASLQGLLRAEPARLRRRAVARGDRRDRRVPARLPPRRARRRVPEMTTDARGTAALRAGIPGRLYVALALFAIVGPFLWILTASFKHPIAIY